MEKNTPLQSNSGVNIQKAEIVGDAADEVGGLGKNGRRGGKNSKFKWGNPKSKPTYGHTFLEHGQKQTAVQLSDRARALGHQVGQWLDDQSAADFLEGISKNGEGVYDVKLPSSIKGRSFLPNGEEVITDMARVIVKPDGSIRTAFPYSSLSH